MGDLGGASGNGVGVSAMPHGPISFNIMSNNEGLIVDPSLQPFIAVQANKNMGVPYTTQIVQNNNIVTTTALNSHNLGSISSTSMESFAPDSTSPSQEIQLPKKLCPLEMSIKAANLDLEFSNPTYVIANGFPGEVNRPNFDERIMQPSEPYTLTLQHGPVVVPSSQQVLPVGQVLLVQMQNPVAVSSSPFVMTSNPVILQSQSPDSGIPNLSPIIVPPGPTVPLQHTEITRDESQSITELDNFQNMESLICEVDESEGSTSALSDEEEGETIKPLVLKIRKVPTKPKKDIVKPVKYEDALKIGKDQWAMARKKQIKRKRGPNRIEYDSDDLGWSASDDETLAKVVQKHQEDEAYEKDDECFRRSPKCCNKLCHVKIQPKCQEIAFRSFREMEKRFRGDCYLANCIARKKRKKSAQEKAPPWVGSADKNCEDETVSREIANESNGNQSVSNEIQEAIKESLKDQASAEGEKTVSINKLTDDDDEWCYFLVINGKQRIVCLNLLLNVLRLTQTRIKALQQKIIAGEPLDRMPVLPYHKKTSEFWPYAKKHLDSVPHTQVPYCQAKPPHKRLLELVTRNELYEKFREYYLKETGRELNVKYDTYRRFITTNANIAFPRKGETTCAGCDIVENQTAYRGNCGIKGRSSKECDKPKPNNKRTNPAVTASSDSGDAQQPLNNKRKRKKDNYKLPNGEKKHKEKSVPKEGSSKKKQKKGDVFSLMISHLKTLPHKKHGNCIEPQKHKFLDPALYTTQNLYEDYRKYFLKATNSELGLRYQLYESILLRNRHFIVDNLDETSNECPRCIEKSPFSTGTKKKNNSIKR